MIATNKIDFIAYFKEIEDPRQDEKVLYALHEVLFLILVGVIAGAEGWGLIIQYGEQKLDLLRKYFPYEHGLPSISTLMRVIGMVKKSCIETWLQKQASNIVSMVKDQMIHIDGKSLKGMQQFTDTKQCTHILNVFASELGMTLAQKSIPNKTSEITAIKEVLQEQDIAGSTISIDAMGCQFEIAELIKSNNADYLLALKRNQKSLYEDIESMFMAPNSYTPEVYIEHDKGHGRIETRKCEVIQQVKWLRKRHQHWFSIESIIKITSTVVRGKIGESTTIRYYISSNKDDPKLALKRTRSHWSIENQLHWVLDVQFNEDNSLIRKDNAAQNMSAVRKLALNIINHYKKVSGKKISKTRLRDSSGWGDHVMEAILGSWFDNCS